MVSLALIMLGAFGVAPWAGYGNQLGGVGLIGLIGALMAGLSLLGNVVRLQWRPLAGLAAILLATVCLGVVVVFPPRWMLTRLQEPDGPLFFFETNQPLVALTIDDGLDATTTPLILDALADHQAHATFFVFTDTLEDNRELVERILAEGHELANHQTDDTPLVSLTPSQVSETINQADAALREFTEPKWFRPGGGIATDHAIAAARRRGCACVLGSVFPFDSHLPWSQFLIAYVAERPTPGDILILHDRADRGRRTAGVLRHALPRLAERGLRCVTLTELADTSSE